MLRHEPRQGLALRRLRHSRIRKRSRSREAVRNSPARDQQNTLLAPYALSPLFSVHDPSRAISASVTFRAWRPDGTAHSSTWPDTDRDGGHRLDSAMGRPSRGDTKGDVVWIPGRSAQRSESHPLKNASDGASP